MKNLIIRQMLPEDVPTALIIERSSFSTPWSETSFLTEVRSASSIALLAETDGTGVGYIIVKTVADECHLYDLAVQGTHRRRGIAKALLESILAIISPERPGFFSSKYVRQISRRWHCTGHSGSWSMRAVARIMTIRSKMPC